ncbi:hypothetical protein EUA06_07850 [Nocardioides glacieisoli]|uniref:Uncharacterized protein n=1 Tax=Nocardioides glacieisoli TaxID=1168730 RepID=A0A4Q2RQR4_9ACTN|nr:hypothetical protein [Nocardioides glacieisoli]RYB91237.1 hypothetical protein EUA06_07850 [Nocardioides glacieisoli]
MSDLEARLRDTLTERAGAAPDALRLATGARRRLRRRRTTWAVAAAAVVAAGVPLGLDQLGPSSDGGGRIADEPTATSGLPPGVIETGYRAESWHDVTFEVPVDWGYGGTSGWCTVGATPDEALPLVTRPDTLTPAIACSPINGYGVTIGDGAALDPAYDSGHVWQFETEGASDPIYPDGAWLGYWYDADTVVTVVAPDRATARRLVDSVETNDGVDPNDCPATLGEAEAATTTESYATFSICRYGPDDLLEASRRLIGRESSVAEDAIFSSPRRTADYDCPTENDLSRIALLSSGGYVATAVTEASCPGWNGLFRSGVVQDLTPEALRQLDLSQLPVPPEE